MSQVNVNAASIVATTKFRIDKTSWSEIGRFEKKIDTLRSKLKGLKSDLGGLGGRMGSFGGGGGSSGRNGGKYGVNYRGISQIGFAHRQQEAFLKSIALTARNGIGGIGADPLSSTVAMKKIMDLQDDVRSKKLTWKEYQNSVREVIQPMREVQRLEKRRTKDAREAIALQREKHRQLVRDTAFENRISRSQITFESMLKGLNLSKHTVSDARKQFANFHSELRAKGPLAMGAYQNKVMELSKHLRHMSANTTSLWMQFNKLRTTMAVVAVVAGATVGAIANSGKQMESSRILMKTVFGETAGDQMKYLRQESDRLGFSLLEGSKSYAQMAIAMREGGADMSSIQDIFSSINEYALVTGSNSDDLSGIFRALIQMYSKTTVSAEELRGQLGDRMPGAWAIAAKSMGMTTEKFDKAVTARLIKANELVPALAMAMRELASPGLQDALQQLGVSQERFYNALRSTADVMFQGGIKQSLAGFFDEMAIQMGSPHFRKVMVNLAADFAQIANVISYLLTLIPALIHDWGELQKKFPSVSMNPASMANPLTLGIAPAQAAKNLVLGNQKNPTIMGGVVEEIKISINEGKFSDLLDFEVTKKNGWNVTRTKSKVKE